MIHTNICGPFIHHAMGGYRFFITFIDDFSRHGHIELIHEKSNSFEALKDFKAKILELHKEKKIKTINSNRYGEYYGRYDETRCNPGPFARYLHVVALIPNIQYQELLNRMRL